jgi:ABC-type lipoprotein release transport system permease subunit
LALSRFLTGTLFGISGADPVSSAIALVALFAVGGGASILPALRAARIDPATVLRDD